MSVTPVLYLRRAILADVDTILAWRSETAEWLAEKHGTDQWQLPYPRETLEARVSENATFMAMLAPHAEPVGTITVSSAADDALWTPEEHRASAWYISKCNVRVDMHGCGVGGTLITWARGKAAAAGVALVRLDAWTTNTALHRYYVRQGFRYVRTVPGKTSGALFEGPSIPNPAVSIVEVDGVEAP